MSQESIAGFEDAAAPVMSASCLENFSNSIGDGILAVVTVAASSFSDLRIVWSAKYKSEKGAG